MTDGSTNEWAQYLRILHLNKYFGTKKRKNYFLKIY